MEQPREDTRRREVHITRLLDAPPARVFEFWTRPEHLAHWWGPKDEKGRDFTVPHCEVDARPGGRWRMCMRAPDGTDYWHQGVFREVEPPRRLVFTHAYEETGGLGAETVVTVDLEEVGGRTRMSFRQGIFETVADADGHAEGWNECFDKLGEHVANA